MILKRERIELEEIPEIKLQRLTEIYKKRGLKKETSLRVTKELTNHDVLATHVKDELGINEVSQAKPIQAALTLGASFTVSGILPLIVVIFLLLKIWNITYMVLQLYY